MFLKEKIKRILNRQPEMMKSSIPLYTFYKNKYGSELLIDIVALKDIKKYLAGKAVHTLTYYDITFITEGEGRFVIGHQTYNAVSRDVFFSRPGEIRSWEIKCIKNGYALIFEDEFLSSFFKDTQFVQHLSYFHPGETSLKLQLPEELYIHMLQLLQHIKKEIDTYQPGNVHMLRALLYEALMLLDRCYQKTLSAIGNETLTGSKENNSPYIERFIKLVEENLKEQHSVQFYADCLCITPNYLNELVHSVLYTSAKQYIRNKVMNEARKLLAYTDIPVSEIALILHFSTVSYFIRSFRQHTGKTPFNYRREQQP